MSIMKIVKNLKRADWRAEVFWRLRDIERFCIRHWYTCVEGGKARMVGVRMGRGVVFMGKTRMERFKHSTIEIGDGCVFNAHPLFNQLCRSYSIIQTATDFAQIRIGRNSGFSGVRISSEVGVYIGNNVTVGANSMIMDRDWHHDLLGTKPAPVRIGDNVFIGMDCKILKGVTIGDNAVIGAGSVVNKDIPANAMAAGVPCRVIKMKSEE